MGKTESSRDANVQEGGRRRVGSGGSGRRRPAQSRRPLSNRFRTIGSHRRTAALRHTRVQDGEARPRPATCGNGGGRRDFPRRCGRRHGCACCPAAIGLRRDSARRRRRPASRFAGARPRVARHPLRHGVPDPAESAVRRRRDSGRPVHQRAGQARGHHRRRRHRR